MELRHEWKHLISAADRLTIRQRLSVIAAPDSPGEQGRYCVRSLYFDNLQDKALREKMDGVSRREKFRIRCYDLDNSLIHLECKRKIGGLGHKDSCLLTPDEVQAIQQGRLNWMAQDDRALVRELYCKMRTQGLQPKTLVDYTREAFVYAPGNVRVTLDYDIRTGLGCTDFLNPECAMIPAGNAPIILEVKWDAFLPDVIRDAVQLSGRRPGAFSKYQACRIYG